MIERIAYEKSLPMSLMADWSVFIKCCCATSSPLRPKAQATYEFGQNDMDELEKQKRQKGEDK
jgi:hypothetical protein